MLILKKGYVPFENQKTIVTIGKFDGVHRGHMKIIDRLEKEKKQGNLSLAVSFINHPRIVMDKEAVELLSSEQEKTQRLEMAGLDMYCGLVFDDKLMNTSAEDFFEQYIVKKWNAQVLVVGDDFCFGKDRRGNITMLKVLCSEYGVKLVVVDRLLYENKPVSSSRIKECLKTGQIEKANEMLGYSYTFEGVIVDGNRLGRTIGFPTINIYPENGRCIPAYGVYGSNVYLCNKQYLGITNIGVKPTVSEKNKPGLETNIIDFNRDVYGENVKITLEKYIRPEKKFTSLDELKEQINFDKKYWTNC